MALLDWVDSISRVLRIGGKVISYEDNQPPSIAPSKDGDLWIESLSAINGRWELFGGKWYSGVNIINHPISAAWSGSSVTTSFRDIIPFSHEYDNFDIFIRRLTLDTFITTAHSSTNFVTFQPRQYTTTSTADWNMSAPTTTANLNGTSAFSSSSYTTGGRIYRNTRNINSLFPNLKGIYLEGTKSGSPSGFNATLVISYRVVRK